MKTVHHALSNLNEEKIFNGGGSPSRSFCVGLTRDRVCACNQHNVRAATVAAANRPTVLRGGSRIYGVFHLSIPDRVSAQRGRDEGSLHRHYRSATPRRHSRATPWFTSAGAPALCIRVPSGITSSTDAAEICNHINLLGSVTNTDKFFCLFDRQWRTFFHFADQAPYLYI